MFPSTGKQMVNFYEVIDQTAKVNQYGGGDNVL